MSIAVLRPAYWPKYNPLMIDLAMASRGMDTHDLAKAMDLPETEIDALVEGKKECSEEDMKWLILILQYPRNFFEQYPETTTNFEAIFPFNETIDYYAKYPIMRITP